MFTNILFITKNRTILCRKPLLQLKSTSCNSISASFFEIKSSNCAKSTCKLPNLKIRENAEMCRVFRPVPAIMQEVGPPRMRISKLFLDNVVVRYLNGFQIAAPRITIPNDFFSGSQALRLYATESKTGPTEAKPHVAPKNILHNIFNTVAQELKNNEYKLYPTYQAIKEGRNSQSWQCTYHIKWPEPHKFSAIGKTKKDASHRAANAGLIYLKSKGRLTNDGHPILLDESEATKAINSAAPRLNLATTDVDRLNSIIRIHGDQFMPYLINNMDGNNNETEGGVECKDKETVFFNKFRQKFLGGSHYLAKEKISLPISVYKEDFINLLNDNNVVIVKGEPGCGKSTRIPQYVLEGWLREAGEAGADCRIAVTQPRRIAAISLAERVANERDESCGQLVGYQVRLKSSFNPITGRILYCTTGILLRYLQSDPTLSMFTHVILDEAHERDANTDLLMNILREVLTTNPNLKLVVMSATIDTDMFREYFKDAPVMHIPGFTYPVDSFFLDDLEIDLKKSKVMCKGESPSVVHEDVAKVILHIHKRKPEGAILCFLPGWEDISKISKLIPPSTDMTVLCLHSRLPHSEQWKIFSRPPPGVRKVILATNIAETSVTIDDVVYVIDTGVHKENRFDNLKGILCIDNHWISKSSMKQRKGRAGRVRPGESFHLYTKSKFNALTQFTVPEILRTSLTKIVLDAKVYTNNMDALEFMGQLPSPPEKMSTRRAVKELKDLQLLDDDEKLTPLGRTLANFQLEPKLAKVLVNSVVYKCVTPIVDIITLFSADTEIFNSSLTQKENIKRVKSQGCQDSDHLAVMRLFEKWLELMEESDEYTAQDFCNRANLVHNKLTTIAKLRQVHLDKIYDSLHNSLPVTDSNSDSDELVKAVLLSGVGTLLVHRNWDIVKGRYKKKQVFITNHNQSATITPESVNYKKTKFNSDFLIYINEVRSNIRRTTLVRECSVISPLATLLFSNRPIKVTDIGHEKEVLVGLKDTKVEILCKKSEAELVQKCRESLEAAYQYFIFQMTAGGELDKNANKVWDEILKNLNELLSQYGSSQKPAAKALDLS